MVFSTNKMVEVFVEQAIELLTASTTLEEATQQFKRSCIQCCNHKHNLQCHECPVMTTYQEQAQMLEDMERKAQRKQELEMVKALEAEALAIYQECKTHRELLEHQDRLEQLTEMFLILMDSE